LWRLHVHWEVASGSWCEIIDPITRLNPTHDSAEYCAAEQEKNLRVLSDFHPLRDLLKLLFPSRSELSLNTIYLGTGTALKLEVLI
jgi:hypothetical protein